MELLDPSAISVWCFLMKTLQSIRKPPVDHSLGCLGWSTGVFRLGAQDGKGEMHPTRFWRQSRLP